MRAPDQRDDDGVPPSLRSTARHFRGVKRETNAGTRRFIFATGIECSYPTIGGRDGGTTRVDELIATGHERRWREDFALVGELGVSWLRYGPPWYRVHLGPDRFAWDWLDERMEALRRARITPILDLCHFGVPDWIGDFQNPELPRHLASYARAIAERYPWVWCWTPVNEMYVCAEFSGFYGWWNERLRTHRGFVTALKNVARASVEAMHAIAEVRRDALFILCESSERTIAQDPDLVAAAELYNERRFLSLDLVCGRRVGSGMYRYLLDHGMTDDEYLYFLDHRMTENVVIGHDFYTANEHLMRDDGTRVAAGDVFGYYPIALQYYQRYNLPVMHTETNAVDDQVGWLWRTWANVQQLRHDGVPLCGMTWYSLLHQIDWDTALREANGRTYPVGLYDLDRRITPIGEAFRDLVARWRSTPLLPNGPLTLAGSWRAFGEGEPDADREHADGRERAEAR